MNIRELFKLSSPVEIRYEYEEIAARTNSLYADLVRTYDVTLFLNKWGKLIQGMEQQYRVTSSLRDMINEFNRVGSRYPEDKSPKETAIKMWRHEIVHQAVYDEAEIRSQIGVWMFGGTLMTGVVIPDTRQLKSKYAHKPFTFLSLQGRVLLAPDKIGLGYRAETHQGRILVRASRRRY